MHEHVAALHRLLATSTRPRLVATLANPFRHDFLATNDEVIVRSTVELARGLGLRVTAEGVESQASWDRLASFGCHNAQGFLLSRPLPPEAFAAWLSRGSGSGFALRASDRR